MAGTRMTREKWREKGREERWRDKSAGREGGNERVGREGGNKSGEKMGGNKNGARKVAGGRKKVREQRCREKKGGTMA